MKFLSFKRLIVLATAGALVVFGVAFQKYKFFPYPQIRALAKDIKDRWGRPDVDPIAAKADQYAQIPGDARFAKIIDTALLPVAANGIRLAALFPFPKSGGGIAVVDQALIIVDWLGGVYCFENGAVRKLAFPPLPNNVDAFVKHAPPLTPGFRVHDVEYLASANSLAISHEFFDPKEKAIRLVVSMIAIDEKTFAPTGDYKTIFSGDLMTGKRYSGIAAGGRLLAKSPDKLLLTTGDYNQDNVFEVSEKLAQLPGSTLGKIMEIDLNSGRHRMISLGHRNPQGIIITEDGMMLSTEHGPAGGDELNQITEGANFGWPHVTFGTDYGTYDWPNAEFAGEHGGYTLPLYAWLPSMGIANLIQVKGFERRWDRDLLVASLKGSTLFRLRMDQSRIVYSEPIWIGERLRDLAQMGDGTIALWSDDANHWFLRPDAAKLRENKRAMDIAVPPIIIACMSCHHFGETNPLHPGPSLSRLLGRTIASDNYSKYSDALKQAGGVWTQERLKEFLRDPTAFASGTLMPKMELSTESINNIVEFFGVRSP